MGLSESLRTCPDTCMHSMHGKGVSAPGSSASPHAGVMPPKVHEQHGVAVIHFAVPLHLINVQRHKQKQKVKL